MVAYYNEFDPFAADWLRELIKDGLIADGVVDDRSITDVQPEDLKDFTQCHFFAGIGGWSVALRQSLWSDDRPVWTGSCPCQPFSTAGKQGGAADERHLWPVWFRLIRECRPDTIFGEQVAGAAGFGWLDAVSTDLENENYACGAAVLGAHSIGAPHIRQRLWVVADSNGKRCNGQSVPIPQRRQIQESAEAYRRSDAGELADCDNTGPQGRVIYPECTDQQSPWAGSLELPCTDGKARQIPAEPAFFPLVDGLQPARLGILCGAGNAIVPQVAAEFIRAYLDVKTS